MNFDYGGERELSETFALNDESVTVANGRRLLKRWPLRDRLNQWDNPREGHKRMKIWLDALEARSQEYRSPLLPTRHLNTAAQLFIDEWREVYLVKWFEHNSTSL